MRLSRLTIDSSGRMNKQLLDALKTDHAPAARVVQRLMTIPGVGQVLSLTSALEMGDMRTVRSRAKLRQENTAQPYFQTT